ncbi:MAG TPA: M12 family metallo-peptidase, partial [Oligoflexia bacterium]|nr:M12 family metallo-peptidase [Oligoflexia bacterium]
PSSEPYLLGFFRIKDTFYQLMPLAGAAGAYQVSELAPQAFHDLEVRWYEAPQAGFAPADADGPAAAALKRADIATEADYEFYAAHANANALILAIINAVDAIYRAELNITLNVVYQHVWTSSSDPYTTTNPDTLIEQFTNYWQSHFTSRNYDLAHYWTGKNLDGNVVGVAWVDAVCKSYRYGISAYLGSNALDVPLAAHEIGHNFGAEHDSCTSSSNWIMCPWVISNASRFSASSKSAVGSYMRSVSCLEDVVETPPNSAPVLAPIGAKSVHEGSLLAFALSASDAEGDALSYSAAGLPAGAILSGTQFSYTPPYNTVPSGWSSTSFNVTFTVSDIYGLTDSETVAITVEQVNVAPVFTTPTPAAGTEG